MQCCSKCNKKGCGAYHDICPQYIEEKRKINELKKRYELSNVIQEYSSDLSIRIHKMKRNKRRS